MPKDISASDLAAMRTAFKKKYWELEERSVPGRSYLEKKLDEIEKGELRAEPLTEVISAPEDDPDTLKAVWSANNELRAVRVGAKAPLPQGPEDLRKRLTLLGTAWLFTALQQTHKQYLKGLDPQLFQEYVNYLLGEHVYGLVAKDSSGSSLAGPSWPLVLAYDQAVRSKAIQLVRKGAAFKDALKTAWEDAVVKERNFTTPLCLESVQKRPWPGAGSSDWTAPPPPKFPKGKGKGKGKDKGKGPKGSSLHAAAGGVNKTPDGRNVCFRFNQEGGGCKTKCRFAHVCGVCFKKDVPMFRCNHAK